MSPIELGPCSELFPVSAPVAAQAESSVSMSLTAANCRPARSVNDDGSTSAGLSILGSDEDREACVEARNEVRALTT